MIQIHSLHIRIYIIENKNSCILVALFHKPFILHSTLNIYDLVCMMRSPFDLSC